MSAGVRFGAALAAVAVVALLLPGAAHAWTPGTHMYLGETVLGNLATLPAGIAALLRAFPYDFLYGTIAPDTSMAKKYAPVGRHCHYWHVGQEVFDLADSERLRAFGLGYLCHLAADVVAHNHFVPRQLLLTATTASVGHSYWETRVETHLGDAYARSARDLIRLDHEASHAHLDRILSPTLFSITTNRVLFRGMVTIADLPPWQFSMRTMRDLTRWPLTDRDVERHLGLAYDYMIELLRGEATLAREFDPSGDAALAAAKDHRRRAIREGVRRASDDLRALAERYYGLPDRSLPYWSSLTRRLPWRATAAATDGGAPLALPSTAP